MFNFKKIKNDPQSALLMKKRLTHGIVSFVRYFFLLALSYVVLFQLIFMISYSIRPPVDAYNPSVVWIPSEFTLENFTVAYDSLDYLNSGLVSVYIMMIAALIEVFTCAVIAYGFARFDFKEKGLVFFLVLVTIMVPVQMLVVPMYLNFSHFDILGIGNLIREWTGTDIRPNMLNTAWTFYLPSLFGVGVRSGLFIFIYRKFFEGLPRELEEAAYVDGAGPLRTFLSVILPSSGVVFLTVTIFSSIWHWNENYLSGLFLQEKPSLAVMMDLLDTSLEQNGGDNRMTRMAACLLFILPMLIMYMILQRKFVQSIDRVGIVG
ncbi:MAG: carbohydrate ABC transporter permease [Ruminococcaceae bacterium]|nr:carbohydrate ABC transporter permease [Oscillospiraceae bacterium]